MVRWSPIGWVLVALTAIVAIEAIVVAITGTTSSFWASAGWNLALVILIVIAAVLAIASFGAALARHQTNQVSIKQNPVAQFLFQDTNSAVLWLMIRVYVGLQWLEAGLEKVREPVWVGAQAGTALRGFIMGAISASNGAHPTVQGWYAGFLQHAIIPNVGWFSYIVAFGELLLGIALIIGVFTGLSAFAGAFANMNYMLAGTTSTNPILAFLQLFLILAWRVAGYYGVDRVLLPALGTPWEPGHLFQRGQVEEGGASPRTEAPSKPTVT